MEHSSAEYSPDSEKGYVRQAEASLGEKEEETANAAAARGHLATDRSVWSLILPREQLN